MQNVVVVGGGLAGFRFVQSLRDAGYDGAVTVVSEEEHLPYDRPPLSKQLLAGTFTEEQCALPGEAAEVEWKLGRRAERLDRDLRVVVLDDGSEVAYDGLLIATGRRARRWDGALPSVGVHTLRDLADTAAFRADIGADARVVIIGAGFIGCEVAATLRKEGVDVTIVDVAAHPMPVMGPEIGARAARIHEAEGVRFRLGKGVAAIEGDDRVTGVRLEDGELLEASVVLVAVGSLPNSEWFTDAGLAMDRGVVICDETCAVLDANGAVVPEVFAAGDIAAWPHRHAEGAACIEHWSNARDMADLAARNLLLAVEERTALASVPTFWSDQYNVKIKSAGFLRAVDTWTIVEEDADKPSLLAEGHRNGELVGAVAFNMNRSIIGYQRSLANVKVGT
ncbi:NAD(P)/FAD-dependent oxidoreductase [Nocardioides humilatus]|uniref:NAD(P)/FAD-dependent oxidoreductase n=1 Tax=Nocardioides humilatus TaxID=2607660 RepID=A0A5B1LMV8_9ACTN|nr:FAD-dependent oxidoreductase [Nocardioides humilatus]KAA1421883.1 NAD(P)/FAD-dependent oxidoreductase [Nocardioides humilatus]